MGFPLGELLPIALVLMTELTSDVSLTQCVDNEALECRRHVRRWLLLTSEAINTGRLYILCWREHSRRKLSPTLATPTTLALTTLVAQCVLSLSLIHI